MSNGINPIGVGSSAPDVSKRKSDKSLNPPHVEVAKETVQALAASDEKKSLNSPQGHGLKSTALKKSRTDQAQKSDEVPAPAKVKKAPPPRLGDNDNDAAYLGDASLGLTHSWSKSCDCRSCAQKLLDTSSNTADLKPQDKTE